jgi:signal transduction histidine kinase
MVGYVAYRCGQSENVKERLDVEVLNEAAGLARSDLAELGSGLGLTGLRERIEGAGGRFEAGPTTEGGWRLSASLAP